MRAASGTTHDRFFKREMGEGLTSVSELTVMVRESGGRIIWKLTFYLPYFPVSGKAGESPPGNMEAARFILAWWHKFTQGQGFTAVDTLRKPLGSLFKMRHLSRNQHALKNRREVVRKLATMSLIGLMLLSNAGCRSGGGGLGQRIRDCRLFNIFHRNQQQTVVASGDPCCGSTVVTTADPCATGSTIVTSPGAVIQTTPSTITVPSGTTSVPDLAPLDNKPTSNIDAKGANFNRPITSTPSTLQAQIGGSANLR